MDILGITIPGWTAAMGLIVTAFLTGIGIGLGSEIGKYLINKYITRKIDKLDEKIRKLDIKNIVRGTIGGNENMSKFSIDIEPLDGGMFRTYVFKPGATILGIKRPPEIDYEKTHKNIDDLEEWLDEKLRAIKR